MSFFSALWVLNGVGGWAGFMFSCLTPVTAARFDVLFNVVFCCYLFMYILIK